MFDYWNYFKFIQNRCQQGEELLLGRGDLRNRLVGLPIIKIVIRNRMLIFRSIVGVPPIIFSDPIIMMIVWNTVKCQEHPLNQIYDLESNISKLTWLEGKMMELSTILNPNCKTLKWKLVGLWIKKEIKEWHILEFNQGTALLSPKMVVNTVEKIASPSINTEKMFLTLFPSQVRI